LKRCLTLCWLLAAAGGWGCLEAVRRAPPHRESAAPARPEAAKNPAVKPAPSPRPSPVQRDAARQINEYAYWCIDKGLWQEARLHLEQAAQRDSTTASYQNNLAIIYEHLGLAEQADAAYRRAQALWPGQQAYQENAQLFARRQRTAHPDSAGPQADSTQAAPPAPTGE